MLGDRDYMRAPDFRSETPIYVRVIILLCAVFLIQCFLGVYGGWSVDKLFALSWDGIKQGYVWQILTYQFLHAWPSPFHLLFNCIGLFFLGRAVQNSIGNKGFLKVYLGAGFAGGILQLLAAGLLPVYPEQGISVVGASAGVYGLLGAFATLQPMREITVLLFFVIPVTLRIRTLFWIAFGFAAFFTFFPQGVTADAAHLGGILFGVAFIRWFHWGDKPAWLVKLTGAVGVYREKPGQPASKARVAPAPASTPSREKSKEDNPDFIASQVDPILDKISENGLHSLTDKEREILEKARNRMGKR